MAAVRALLLLALVGAAAAFTAPTMGGLKLRSNKAAMTMKAESPMPKAVTKALAPAIALANIAAPAFAEGTGEALGVDDGRILLPIVFIPIFVGLLYGGFASEQDNSDFFDTYDQRRK